MGLAHNHVLHVLQIPKPMDQRFNELMLKNTEKYPYAFHTMVQPHRATIQVVHPKTVKLLMKSTEPKDDITGGIYMHLMPWLGKIGSNMEPTYIGTIKKYGCVIQCTLT